jgi:hypothetical protein
VAAALTVRVSGVGVAWLREPEVPVNCRVDVPALADAVAVKLTGSGVPGVRVNVVGEELTPDGSPLRATEMVPVNPPIAVAVSVADCAAPPAVRLRLLGLTESEKSGVTPPPPPPPPLPPLPLPVEVTVPPQPQQNPASTATTTQENAGLAAVHEKKPAAPAVSMQVL